ncbi:Omega-amidase NIT2 [Paramyrothecium foliicola]|nr:Omega-amidase NIT2 [Paramyrothecium foliicola]
MPAQQWSLWIWVLLLTQINALSWPKKPTVSGDEGLLHDSPPAQPHTLQVSTPESGLSNVYAKTLNELQALESEPLCHRVAARLLIHNCQLLDGKDEATALTDSGRATRDFVDSYAASLAICDLERGSFKIPHSCSKFREASLSRISPPTVPQLHASPAEVQSCLEGLAQSDSAWSTWISYRHKALRFCEAARAENEKDRNLHLYRKLTQILEKLTTEVEAELEARYVLFTDIIREAGDRVEELAPRINDLSSEIGSLERMLKKDIHQTSQAASQVMRDGLEYAKDLQSTLGLLLRTAMEHNAELATSHEVALQQSTGRVESEVASIITALATVALSSASLQQDIEHSKNQVYMLTEKHDALEMSGLIAGRSRIRQPLDTELNFNRATSFIRDAATRGAHIAVLPEYHLMSWVPESTAFTAAARDSNEYLERYQALARELHIAIVPGTLLEPLPSGSLANACYFIGPDGDVLARYQKKNLWHPERPHLTADAETPHTAFDTPWGRVGLIVCWDLAFPEACRALVADGARIIVCPAFWLAGDAGQGAGVNPQSEQLYLEAVTVARAFENTCAMVFVNTAAPAGQAADQRGNEYVGLSQVAMPLQGALGGSLGPGEAMKVVDVDLGVLDVAERVYKVREDLKRDGWHYAYQKVNAKEEEASQQGKPVDKTLVS